MGTAPATESDPRFPSGPWEGYWIQKEQPAGKHTTELRLAFGSGVMTGEGRDWVGAYTVAGAYDVATGRCQWVKSYTGKHSVKYEGYNEGKGIWGGWSIEQAGYRLHGGFHIWPVGMPAPTDRTLAEEIDAPEEVREEKPGLVPVGVP
ncbi:MAG: hypothetical protein K2W96_26230 [Gemmataceae bacterium]|nr:hypothetical protein [Gemmataceae bacterium]